VPGLRYDVPVNLAGLKVVVRGAGDIGSAVAHRLFRESCAVIIHEDPKPTTTRRGMAFADAVFDGRSSLEGIVAVCAEDIGGVRGLLAAGEAIPIYVGSLAPLLTEFAPAVLADARMLKHREPQVQRGLAEVTIGLGPDVVVGRHADVAVETSWDDLGRVITEGASMALAGEPREIEGHARDRYIYAPCDGVFRTKIAIGDEVRRGQALAEIRFTVLTAPLDGVLRGLTRDGVPVTTRTKVIEVDPRGVGAEVRGIGERPRRIADGVVAAIRDWNGAAQTPEG
jgi:xanthine dehydrogenase accessory factor